MQPATKRPVVVLLLCALVTLTFLVLWARGFVPLRQLEFFVQDWQTRLGRRTPGDNRLVLVGIDKPVYAADFSAGELEAEPVLRDLQNNFPWSRAVWARLIEKLSDAGAKVIAFDLVFASASDGDEALRDALEKYRDRVVVGYNFSVEHTDRGDFQELQLPNASVWTPPPGQAPVTDDRLGYVNIWPDSDNTLRRAQFRMNGEQAGNIVPADVMLESLDARALRKFGRADAIPATATNALRFRYGNAPGHGYRVIPIGEVLSPKLWRQNFGAGAFFKDKLVLIGPTANIFHDEHDTPLGEMLGPEIHLNIMAAALSGEFPREIPAPFWLGFILGAGILAGILCFLIRQPLRRMVIVMVLLAGYLWLAQALFNRAGGVLPVGVPLLVLLGCSLLVLTYDFVLERLERMKLRHTMGLYFSPRVLEAVLADPGSMTPRRAKVTLLLTDLRNSTPLAELLGPKGMFELLNHVFAVQTQAIMSEAGNLEHFLGDQFLSYWGAPQAQPDAADRAAHAAVKVIAAMEQLRTTLSPEVRALFGYGVALHSGTVLVGNKGSAQRLDYGLVGDAVNEAARIESLTKYYGTKMLISRDTFAQFSRQDRHRLVDRVIVKGKSEPVELYDCENPCTPPNYLELCRRYRTAYDEYFFGRFASAGAQFEKLATEFGDGPSRVLADRCAELAAAPPADWHGIWKMSAK